MLETNVEMQSSINDAKIMAREKQPIRHDVYLKHISYYEDTIKTLQMIIRRMAFGTISLEERQTETTTNFCDGIYGSKDKEK